MKRDWAWEAPSAFKIRKHCDRSCRAKTMNLLRGNKCWSKRLLKKEFNKIKDNRKWNSRWLQKSNRGLLASIEFYYGKHAWNKFLKEFGKIPLHDYVDPKYRRVARELNEWLRFEQDIKVGEIFEFSSNWGFPCGDGWTTENAIEFLKKRKVWKILRKGTSNAIGNGKNSSDDSASSPTQYQLLKTRV